MTFLISSLVAFLVITLGAYAMKPNNISDEYEPPEQNCKSGDLKYCKKKLCDLGITDKKTYHKWILRNHPDKIRRKQPDISDIEIEKLIELAKEVTNCTTSDCFGGDPPCMKYSGGKRNKTRKRKTRKKTKKKSRKKSRK